MARLNPDTYPDRQSFDAHARALRREEFDRLAGFARERFALALQRARRIASSRAMASPAPPTRRPEQRSAA